MATAKDNSCVKIAVRLRPTVINKSHSPNVVRYHDSEDSSIIIVNNRPFIFDDVLVSNSSQEQVYERIMKPLLAKIQQGYNCTVLAYGQTGTGKTYTMGLSCDSFEGERVGIIPRCMMELLLAPARTQQEIYISYIEVYNEKVYDLLADQKTEANIGRGKNDGYKFTGGSRINIKEPEDCCAMLMLGNKNRHIRATRLNPQSSRSHAIFTIHVQNMHNGKTTISCLNLVDLAGSESVRRTGHQGAALFEGVSINQGLLTVSKVIEALAKGHKVIPYRDTVLTSILQGSLNRNSYLTLLACISLQQEDVNETLFTLRFAQKAKKMKYTPKINSILGEIKSNIVKTPFQMNAVPNRSSTLQMSSQGKVNRRLMTSPRRPTRVMPANKTFCVTPSKIPKMHNRRINQSTPCRYPTQPTYNATSVASTLYEQNFETYESLHNVIDTQSSTFSLNVSTSTTVDGCGTSVGTYGLSPIVRKYLEGFEKTIDNRIADKIAEMFDAKRDKDKDKDKENEKSDPSHAYTSSSGEDDYNGPDITNTTILRRSCRITFSSSGVNVPLSPVISLSSNAQCSDRDGLIVTSSPLSRTAAARDDSADEIDDVVDVAPPDSSLDAMIEKLNASGRPYGNVTSNGVSNLRRSQRISLYNARGHVSTVNEASCFSPLPQRQSKRLAVIKAKSKWALNNVPTVSPIREEQCERNAVQPSQKKKRDHVPNISGVNSERILATYLIPPSSIDGGRGTNVDRKKRIARYRKSVLDLINTATLQQLQLLPDVGPKTAFKIITHRTLNGKFQSLKAVEKLPIWRGNAWQRFAQANVLV